MARPHGKHTWRICFGVLCAILLVTDLMESTIGKAVAQETPPTTSLGQGVRVRDATEQQRVKSLHEEAARQTYESARPWISRWGGLGVFVIICLILIAFLDRKLKQRERLRRMGFFDPG